MPSSLGGYRCSIKTTINNLISSVLLCRLLLLLLWFRLHLWAEGLLSRHTGPGLCCYNRIYSFVTIEIKGERAAYDRVISMAESLNLLWILTAHRNRIFMIFKLHQYMFLYDQWIRWQREMWKGSLMSWHQVELSPNSTFTPATGSWFQVMN